MEILVGRLEFACTLLHQPFQFETRPGRRGEIVAHTYDPDHEPSFVENRGVRNGCRKMSSISMPHRELSLPTFSCMERSHNVRSGLLLIHRNGDVQDVTANDFFRSPSVKFFRKRIPVNNPAIGTRGNNGHL